MRTIFDFLYREYCRARLAEMRKQLLLVSGSGVTEANCDVGRLSGSNNDLGDDNAATQREALRIH